jgi:hypothetical protein
MRDESLIAIRKEIGRVAHLVRVSEQRIHDRNNLIRFPSDPAEEALAMQELFRVKNLWQEALNRRVLQLFGLDAGVGIKATVAGERDPWL